VSSTGWWEGLTACSSSNLGNDPLAAIMNAPLIRCDVAPVDAAGDQPGRLQLSDFGGQRAALVFALLGRRKQGVV